MMFRKQDFKKMEPLGQGKKHTRIFKAVHLPTGQVFALKEIEAKSIDKLNEYKEEAVQLMKVQPHDNIIKFFGYYFHETNYGSFRLGIVTEFIEGGTCLESVFRRRKKAGLFWKEAELATMFSSLVSACAYLQLKNICHRDIKPANLFLKPNCQLKLIDFGQSKDYFYDPDNPDFETYTMATIRGTPQYLSPVLWKAHVIDGSSRYAEHNIYKSDVFSAGLVLFQLASMGEVSGFNQRTEKINGADLVKSGLQSLLKKYSKDFVSMLQLTLVFEQKCRATFVELEEIFAELDEPTDGTKPNPYIRQYNRNFSNVFKKNRADTSLPAQPGHVPTHTHTHSEQTKVVPMATVVAAKDKKRFVESTLVQNDSCYWFQFGGKGVGKFSTGKRRWKVLSGEVQFPMHFQVVFVAHKKTYYLIGGPPNNNFKEFKNGKLLINEECQLRSDRNFFAAVSHAQKLFLFGGYEASSRKQLRTCESFDLEKQSWHPLASMRKERSMAAACKINEDQILVLGGYSKEGGTLDSIQRYIISQDKFQLLKLRLPIPLRRFVAVRLGRNELLLLGGLTKNSKQSQRVFRLEYGKGEFIQLQNLEKGGVIESEVLVDSDGGLHLFLETASGTSPHAHITYSFEQTQRPMFQTNNEL